MGFVHGRRLGLCIPTCDPCHKEYTKTLPGNSPMISHVCIKRFDQVIVE